jgi:hypothetical protein
MNIGTVIHRTTVLRPSFVRQVSSKSTSTSQSPKQLPPLAPEKLRALVSLYHESQNFISEKNLSAQIDRIFATSFYSSASGGIRFTSKGVLRAMLHQRRSSPRVGVPDMVNLERGWSNIDSGRRNQEVFDALYGVENTNPGLDALLDEEDRIKRILQEGNQDEGARYGLQPVLILLH